MQKRTDSLLFRFGIIFLIFTVITLLLSGFTTYVNQMSAYRAQCETNIRNIGEYLAALMEDEDTGFSEFQENFLTHYDKLHIPIDFTEYTTAEAAFQEAVAREFPGLSYGEEITFDDLSEETQNLYLTYLYEYWTLLFEQAREAFDIPYSYYLIMDETEHNVIYMIDGERTVASDHVDSDYPNAVLRDIDANALAELDQYMYLADEYHNDPDDYAIEWETWRTGEPQDGFQVWNNDWGHTYAYYTPLVIDGQKLGLIGTEIDVATVNREILKNTLIQMLGLGVILIIAVLFMLWFLNRRYISKLVRLQHNVQKYAVEKDSSIAGTIERESPGRDEIGTLANQTAAMILELDDYMNNLIATTRELTETKQQANEMQELVNKDDLTGIRNKNAYDNEIRRMEWQIADGNTEFGIAMIDLNFLKRINDTYGHEQGNIAIKILCRVVCNTFGHSPVFRIGGDEFAVILEKSDYQQVDALIEKFNHEIDELSGDTSKEPWERISAALGYAAFDARTDSSVANVIKRADTAMYARKKAMKAVRLV